MNQKNTPYKRKHNDNHNFSDQLIHKLLFAEGNKEEKLIQKCEKKIKYTNIILIT